MSLKRTYCTAIILLSFLAINSSCSKNNACPDSEKAVLTNYTGLDGCSWVIKLENGEVLEPLNLTKYESNPMEGKKIWVSYKTETNYGSICMVGPIVSIYCLSER